MYKSFLFKVNIETLSPLHIGNGNQLSSIGEFVTQKSEICFVNNDKFNAALIAHDKRDDFVELVLTENIKLDFGKKLLEWGIDWENDLIDRRIPLHQNMLDVTNNNILHQCIKTKQEAYIPGSTLKGVVRTAILHGLLNAHTDILKEVDKRIAEILEHALENVQNNPDDNKWKTINGALSEIKDYWQSVESKILPNRVFQSIRPEDSDNINSLNLCVEQVSRSHFFEEHTEGVDWLEECVSTGAQAQTMLTIAPMYTNADFKSKRSSPHDFEFLRKGNIQQLITYLNMMSKTILDQEERLLQASSKTESSKFRRSSLLSQASDLKQHLIQCDENKNEALIRIGKGKTVFVNTILPLLSNQTLDTYTNLIADTGEKNYPKTRVVTCKDSLAKGWVKLTFEQMDVDLPDIDKRFNEARASLSSKEIIKEKDESTPVEQEDNENFEIKWYDNQIKHIQQSETQLTAQYLGDKKVCFRLNGHEMNNIQLVLAYPKQFIKKGSKLRVVVQGLKKDGTIYQVKMMR